MHEYTGATNTLVIEDGVGKYLLLYGRAYNVDKSIIAVITTMWNDGQVNVLTLGTCTVTATLKDSVLTITFDSDYADVIVCSAIVQYQE